MAHRTLRWLLTALLALSTMTLASCELFEDTEDLLAINIPLEYEIPQALPIIIPGSEAIANSPVENGEIVIDIPTVYLPVDIAGQDERLSAGTSVVKSVQIVGMDMTIDENTLDIPIQPIELRIGTTDQDFDQALPVAITSELAPGFTGTDVAEIIAQNSEAAGEYVGNLQFGIGMGTQLIIPEDNIPEGGQANARFTLRLNIKIAP